MFVFYFGILADLTPPVALAAFAAAPIAGVSGMRIGVQAVRVAMAGFIIPYMAVYAPELMLQGDPTIAAVVWIVFKALLAISLWGVASVGYLWQPVSWMWRVWALVAASFLVAALPITDEIGVAAAALFFAVQFWRRHRTLKVA
jgi:TRAP-type uncharacterized transport system fused permease subunit